MFSSVPAFCSLIFGCREGFRISSCERVASARLQSSSLAAPYHAIGLSNNSSKRLSQLLFFPPLSLLMCVYGMCVSVCSPILLIRHFCCIIPACETEREGTVCFPLPVFAALLSCFPPSLSHVAALSLSHHGTHVLLCCLPTLIATTNVPFVARKKVLLSNSSLSPPPPLSSLFPLLSHQACCCRYAISMPLTCS